MAWTNNDGLYVKFGTEEAQAGRGGEYNMAGPTHVVEFALDLAELSASTQTVLDQHTTLPSGAFIEKVEVIVTTVTAGTNSNLDLGFIRLDRTTELDYNGLLAAADAWHTATVGTITEYTVGTIEAGALIGTALANPGYVVAKADTAAFDSGVVTIRIYWSKVVADPD